VGRGLDTPRAPRPEHKTTRWSLARHRGAGELGKVLVVDATLPKRKHRCRSVTISRNNPASCLWRRRQRVRER